MNTVAPRRAFSRVAFRFFAAVERVGNRLPEPFWLFWILALVVVVLSAVLSATGFSVVQESTGKTIAVRNLLSADGVAVMLEGAVKNFASFPPLPTIIAVMLGAIFLVHAPYGFFMNWAGQQAGEGYEYHLLAIALGLVVVSAGGGALSLDRVLMRRRPMAGGAANDLTG